ncbi:MAG: sulfurtransferase, partial [Solirubrobacteraceae bacterium]
MTAPLISPEQLRRRAAGEGTTLLDVRWELGTGPRRDEYERGHIPGAAFADLDRDLAAPAGAGGRHPLPAAADFQAAMRALGVSDERPVVVYDGAAAISAARAWWLLRYFGHRDVSVLDGGLAAWVAAGGTLATGGETARGAGDFTVRPGAMPVLDADGAATLARDGVLLDARAPERFRGEAEPVDPVAGHIPGARNLPTTLNLTESGRFRDPAALRERFERARAGLGGGPGGRPAVGVGLGGPGGRPAVGVGLGG